LKVAAVTVSNLPMEARAVLLEVNLAMLKAAMEATRVSTISHVCLSILDVIFKAGGMEVVLLRPATVASKVMVSKVEMAIQEVTAVVIDRILIIWHVNSPTSLST
jgi:ABC-type uncharacterized transport system permease subunit